MRFRFFTLIPILVLLVVASGCAGLGNQPPTATPAPIRTLRPTFTPRPAGVTIAPTATLRPTGTATAAPAAAAPATTAPTVAPTAAPATAMPTTPAKASFSVSNASANVRGGPSTAYPIVGQVQQGQKFEITGKNGTGDWWQFTLNGQPGWILGTLVNVDGSVDGVQSVANIPAPPAAAPVQQPAAPRPAAPTQPPAAPPAPATKYAAIEARPIINTNGFVTVRCRLFEKLEVGGIPGTLRVVQGSTQVAPDHAFNGGPLHWANTGMSSENQYLYNDSCKVELSPAVNGAYSAYLVEGGQKVSDSIDFTVTDNTREFALSWKPR